MNLAFQTDLMKKIDLPPEACEQALWAFRAYEKPLALMTAHTSLHNCLPFTAAVRLNRKHGALLCLSAALLLAEDAYAAYAQKGIPDAVYYDTMRDISVWVNTAKREKNVCGLLEFSWVRHALFLNLFQIGRLQYQFYTTNYVQTGLLPAQIDTMPIPNNAEVLNIHIPEGGRLSLEACQASVQAARRFFEQFYPSYAYGGFVCDSWLLDPKNRDFMKPGCNILRFSELFCEVLPVHGCNRELVRRLWATQASDRRTLEQLPVHTDLQKRAKAYLLDGGKTGNGFGYILK